MVNEPEKWTQDKLSAQVKTNKLIKEIIFKTSVGVWHESSLKYIYVNPLIWISIFNVWHFNVTKTRTTNTAARKTSFPISRGYRNSMSFINVFNEFNSALYCIWYIV